MMQSMLHEDALESAVDGVVLRLGSPWIRSLPLACVLRLEVMMDGVRSAESRVVLGHGDVAIDALQDEAGWWYLQDRLAVRLPEQLEAGEHQIGVTLELMIPYLDVQPDAPLVLPFRAERRLVVGASVGAPRASLVVR